MMSALRKHCTQHRISHAFSICEQTSTLSGIGDAVAMMGHSASSAFAPNASELDVLEKDLQRVIGPMVGLILNNGVEKDREAAFAVFEKLLESPEFLELESES